MDANVQEIIPQTPKDLLVDQHRLVRVAREDNVDGFALACWKRVGNRLVNLQFEKERRQFNVPERRKTEEKEDNAQ